MTALVSWSIDRTSLSLSDLVIDSTPTSTYTFADGGVGRVGITRRDTFATDSPFVDGRMRTASVKEESSLAGIVIVQGASWSAVDTSVTALQTALDQFVYTVTDVRSGVSKVWTAYPASVGAVDGVVTVDNVSQFYTVVSIGIPVDPVSA